MNEQMYNNLCSYVEQNIGVFHETRLQRLKELKLKKILERKNPYLFKAKHILLAQDLIKYLLDAYLSSQEETLFGAFLENLAIFINQQIYNGRKSAARGIDLEFEKDDVKYIVSIKSGPNWGNSSQIKKMKDDFRLAKQILRQNNITMNIEAVNGCCYGKNTKQDKGDYFKLCGQKFWEFISGDENLYIDLIEPLGHRAREKNEEFYESCAQIINSFTTDFSTDFCDDGRINWEKLVRFNSEASING